MMKSSRPGTAAGCGQQKGLWWELSPARARKLFKIIGEPKQEVKKNYLLLK
jgi:hypothetical protein